MPDRTTPLGLILLLFLAIAVTTLLAALAAQAMP